MLDLAKKTSQILCFYKLKFGNPWSSKSVDAIFPTVACSLLVSVSFSCSQNIKHFHCCVCVIVTCDQRSLRLLFWGITTCAHMRQQT